VRFIEFMPLEHGIQWGTDVLVPGDEIRQRIHEVFPLAPDPSQSPNAPSRDYVFTDGSSGQVGFINSVSEPFCARCDRIRITADGKLRTCLFSLKEHDILDEIREGVSDEKLIRMLRGVVFTKEKKHHITDGMFEKPARTMSQIGG
jgi:cyclic pyranopterin phosphate synthase